MPKDPRYLENDQLIQLAANACLALDHNLIPKLMRKNLFINKDAQVRHLLQLTGLRSWASVISNNLIWRFPEAHEKLMTRRIDSD